MPDSWRQHPSVRRLAHVARMLGALNDRLVFIGGAVAPILQTDSPFPSARVTKDVDGVAATHTASDYRWICPGDHLGSSGQIWDQVAIDTAVALEIEPGLIIRHASAATFLALKWAAFNDRGKSDPFASHDLEDIVCLVASRPGIVGDVHSAAENVQAFVREWSAWLQGHRDFDELLAANLSQSFDAPSAIAETRDRFIGLTA